METKNHNMEIENMSGIKEKWMSYVRKQSEMTRRDPHAKTKLIGWVIVLFLIGHYFQSVESSSDFESCVTWAATDCFKYMSGLGGVCVAGTVIQLPASICAVLITGAGVFCTVAAGSCIVTSLPLT